MNDKKYAVMVPIDGTWLFVLDTQRYFDPVFNDGEMTPQLFDTETEANCAGEIWTKYRVVEYKLDEEGFPIIERDINGDPA